MKYNLVMNQWIQVPEERNLVALRVAEKFTRADIMFFTDEEIQERLFFQLVDKVKKSKRIEYNEHVNPGKVRNEDEIIYSARLNLIDELHSPAFVNKRIFMCNGREFTEEEVAYAIKQTFPERLI